MIIFHMRGHLSFSQFWFSIYGFYKIVTQSVYPSITALASATVVFMIYTIDGTS